MAQRIIIADDHPLMRNAVSAITKQLWPDATLVEVANTQAAREAAQAGSADLLLLDLNMPDSNGLSALMDFRELFPALPVVIISACEDPRVWQAVRRLGASGFIPKSVSMEEMGAALNDVREGEMVFPLAIDSVDEDEDFQRLAKLTPAQRRILAWVAQGLLNKQIAHEMEISEATVKAHITAIFRRLGVFNRTQAVLVAKKLDIASEVQSEA